MSNLVCKNCKSVAVEYEDYCGGTSYYRCNTCGMRGNKDKFTQQSLFDRITVSPEVLAEKLVYYGVTSWDDEIYASTICDEIYKTRAEAIAATVAKLQEVAE